MPPRPSSRLISKRPGNILDEFRIIMRNPDLHGLHDTTAGMNTARSFALFGALLLAAASQEPSPQPKPKPREKNIVNVTPQRPTGGVLSIDANVPCHIYVDGKEQGLLEPPNVRVISLPHGRHIVDAFARSGASKLRQQVDIENDKQDAVSFEFQAPG